MSEGGSADRSNCLDAVCRKVGLTHVMRVIVE